MLYHVQKTEIGLERRLKVLEKSLILFPSLGANYKKILRLSYDVITYDYRKLLSHRKIILRFFVISPLIIAAWVRLPRNVWDEENFTMPEAWIELFMTYINVLEMRWQHVPALRWQDTETMRSVVDVNLTEDNCWMQQFDFRFWLPLSWFAFVSAGLSRPSVAVYDNRAYVRENLNGILLAFL